MLLIGFGDEFKQTIKLVMYDHQKQLFTFILDAATYQYMETTMEEKRNSWVTHLNEDKMLDIATVNHLEDFELPRDSNISGSTYFKHLFRIDNLLYHWWGEGVNFEYRVIR